MPQEDFDSAVEEARAIEKAAQPGTGFRGKVEFDNAIDLEPKEYADYTFDDLINLYERAGKIIKTSAGVGMPMKGAPAVPGMRVAPPAALRPEARKEMKAKTEEVETKVKALTSEALTKAGEIGKELEKPFEARKPEEALKPSKEEIEFEAIGAPIEFEREVRRKPPKPEEAKAPGEIDLGLLEERGERKEEEEKKERETGIEKEKPPSGEIESGKREEEEKRPTAAPARGKPELRKAARPTAPAIAPRPLVTERPVAMAPAAAVPPILRERAEEAATKKYGEIEQQIMATLGGEMDEASLKKKMLELTKQLFKEKSMNRREQIKLEITVLKDMLARKVKKPAGKAISEKEAKGRMLETIVSTQKTELASTKDRMLTGYKAQVDGLKQKFQDSISSLAEDDEAGRKAAFDKLTFELTSISEQIPAAISKYRDYLTEKHASEIRKLKSSLGKGDEALASDSDARLQAIEEDYAREFSAVRNIIRKQVEALIESAGRAAFRHEEIPVKEAKVQELVAEINEMDEGTLLYYLHGKDPDLYRRYERKHVSRQEVIFRAKELMAREKGLSDDMVRKYFSESEG